MKKLTVPLLVVAACSWISPASAEIPLPPDISVSIPSSDLKKEIAVFSGVWVGNWSGSLDATLVVEQIGPETAKVIYAWGDSPQWNVSAGSRRYDAKITKGGSVEVEFGSATEASFSVRMGSDQSTIRVTRATSKGADTETFQKVSEENISRAELQLKIASAKAARTATLIVKPAANVPASCASFSGEWTGTWHQGIGQTWLWVVDIDTNCVAKFAYLSHSRPPVGFATAEIKDGVFSFLCNRSTGGTCVFERYRDALSARYSNPSGGVNTAVFERVQ